ncbi:integrase arm-type DNA-binding domain-containing protein [Stenotrophomonas maltophilia]|uniref:phage integrase central domain-containing protein n=1 Tax=Stenotrophomonas maltophilia TaxID=40324 RepID=UPI0018D28C25|nr:integrase arm-type DNA-binding domain-containing protein [Stenotrophomonas maltophilia]MBH1380157.1 integrase arm-type DNA-binding domain-containing protein [Stenotrophomonas maltophilia]MBH1396552.1 integrase arm-type DNA-binding domain-containing protein [Stenotrophomonas maltophilia]MBH1472866.1 integrase arm-type DNA-binding domain-containing protein [Stenotrophomonas maltophilia]
MGLKINRLTARRVTTITEPGYHPDGGGLYLQVTASGAKSWVLRYRFEGRRPEMGLGPLHVVSLVEAREAAGAARRLIQAGQDPLAGRRAAAVATASIPTFWEAATAYIAEREAGWTNPKHAGQWTSTLETYAKPVLGDLRVDRIETDHVLAVLRPIWATKTETASRVRQRVEAVLDSVTVQKKRTGDNPARWRGHLALILPKPTAVTKVENFAALPYAELPAFMAALRTRHGEAARALEFTIFTAARTGMTLGASPGEVDLAAGTWTVPWDRMKGKVEHTIPLSKPALALAQTRMKRSLLFPNDLSSEALSENAMLALLKRMGFGHVTVHGFRSTFKDWASETTDFPDDLSEAALAHQIRDKAKAAYKRGKMLEKRRVMMDAWAVFATGRVDRVR